MRGSGSQRMSLHPPFREAAEAWLSEDPDPKTAAELRALIERADTGDAKAQRELHESFDGQLEFGTAGLRGILGPGPQKMNRELVRKVPAGLGAYLRANVPDVATRGVLLGHDSRHNSRVFAEDTARVLAGAGIKALLAPRPWPTPTTAWAVTATYAAAGVIVTASHNPPAYNGYKVYWGNGAQIIPPHDQGIAAQIADAPDADAIACPPFAEAERTGRASRFGDDVERRYLDAVRA